MLQSGIGDIAFLCRNRNINYYEKQYEITFFRNCPYIVYRRTSSSGFLAIKTIEDER